LSSTRQGLRGKTLGIIGYGHIGRRVAELALRLGVNVIVNDPPLWNSGINLDRHIEHCTLLELVSRSDILTNHVPYTVGGTYKTVGLLGENILNTLPQNSLVIHTSRGGIIVERALENLLETHAITAAIDVWQSEPYINAYLARQCLLATPHIAGYSFEGKVNGSITIARALEHYMAEVLHKPIAIDWRIFEEALRSTSIQKPLDYTDHTALLEALRASRQLESDSAQLLACLENNNAEGFDYLRATYPVRREILR
ncbi:MAG: NAD(P)-dependent oxidoreductase, partial [Bacteroidota bacterium]|nr:hypothetical protein [Candidatus Kapabacteria bacterium]MDW8221057.1 NAD(P)-dependent oxidoreductase [Bacteroidota bacterium]